MKKFRAPAVPLMTSDPMFSLWSAADRITDDTTRHWSGVRQFVDGIINIDGVVYQFLGKTNPIERRYHTGYPEMKQISCEVRPLTTVYTLEEAGIRLTLEFVSPLVLDDLMLMSRTLSYMNYKIEFIDGQTHQCRIYLGVSGEFCVNEPYQSVSWGETKNSAFLTSGTENMLKQAGDDHRIEWGSLHVSAPQMAHVAVPFFRMLTQVRRESVGDRLHYHNYMYYPSPNMENMGPKELEKDTEYRVDEVWPTLLFTQDTDSECEDSVIFAYDDVKAIQYFGDNLDDYWKKDGMTFDEMLQDGIKNRSAIINKAREFEKKLMDDAKPYGEKYQQILALAYRQTVAGHKLVSYNGEPLFFSKENFSNGCIATVDVTYPSTPLFYIYQPALVKGMLDPVFELVYRDKWEYEFAPHDVGTYPLANGQKYGFMARHLEKRPDPRDSQMPIEECGNMILCVAGVCRAEGSDEYYKKHEAILTKWADYLVNAGFDPENQLCTDDFAGHLAHNCNLSVKAICALEVFAQLKGDGGEKYRAAAEDFAKKWVAAADDGDHYRLTFDTAGTWSTKYNMVWDRLFDLNLFPEEVYKKETECYKKNLQPYGLPLDCRCEYTKTDWELWSAAMCGDEAFTTAIIDAMYAFLNETPDRVPFTDLHFTRVPRHRGFQARTVQGGLWMPVLMDKWKGR